MSKIFIFFIVLFLIFVGIVTFSNDFIYFGNLKYNKDKISGLINSEVVYKKNKAEFTVNHVFMSVYNNDQEFFYGDFVSFSCSKLEMPQKYYFTKSIFYICNKPKIIYFEKNKKPNFLYFIFKLKYFLSNRISVIYERPYDGFVSGILFGSNNMDNDLKQIFSNAGISHITAISGYNVSIIVAIISTFFLKIGFNRFKIFYINLFFIISFCLFTGASSSVVRASVMAIVVLFSSQFGRLSNSIFVLIFTAFLMVLFNPYILLFDLGFQLSFLATFSIVFLKPKLDKIFAFDFNFLSIKDSLTSTLSATIFTFPILYFNFHKFNFFSILINLLILNYIPFLMLFSFLSLFCSFFSILAIFIMKYIIFICEFFT